MVARFILKTVEREMNLPAERPAAMLINSFFQVAGGQCRRGGDSTTPRMAGGESIIDTNDW